MVRNYKLSLGRRYEPDPRNDLFPIRAMLRRVAYDIPVTKFWHSNGVLDQGSEGSCVGHGFAHKLMTNPYSVNGITHEVAVQIYYDAQKLDNYPGENYAGTSVLAGVKALQNLYEGIESYRWATSINDMVAVIGYFGPVVIGVNWYEGMFEPTLEGTLVVRGQVQGGHCVIVKGVNVETGMFLIQNSWGITWGQSGCAYISFDDMARLLRENGEACIVIHKEWWRRVPTEVLFDGVVT